MHAVQQGMASHQERSCSACTARRIRMGRLSLIQVILLASLPTWQAKFGLQR